MNSPTSTPSIWRTVQFWRFVGQAIAVMCVIALLSFLWINLTRNLQRLGLGLGFGFLRSQAGFTIGESLIPYQSSDTYGQALLVGLVNSLSVIMTGIGLATVIGLIAGIARLSNNWLVRHLALVYVEVLRNTPLLLQLFFWYFAVFLSLPKPDNPVRWLGFSFSNSGIALPGGWRLTPEFSALLLGLAIYTGTFIAEIVRGGIQSVPKGQWEAARSLGLKSDLTMRLVILPQALRAIIPPLGNQYLNLAKNSSLAIAVGFPDLYAVASTTFNQTGRAVEVMILISVAYLTISLTIALLLNLYNRRVQLVER
ncbi:amino acid ABC transporter permease [Leptodesmis sichuanensis]|uniref:amino acid ABC transporter permease n=1 Tax=Leptodesmis sichuanensis TaxID=2906798 RepID=UPI001EEBDE48